MQQYLDWFILYFSCSVAQFMSQKVQLLTTVLGSYLPFKMIKSASAQRCCTVVPCFSSTTSLLPCFHTADFTSKLDAWMLSSCLSVWGAAVKMFNTLNQDVTVFWETLEHIQRCIFPLRLTLAHSPQSFGAHTLHHYHLPCFSVWFLCAGQCWTDKSQRGHPSCQSSLFSVSFYLAVGIRAT